MDSLVYVRLFGYTMGALLMLFWMVVILGFRRQRNFERVFFFLCLALFLFYSGSLLALNARIYYPVPPLPLYTFALTLLSAGLCFLPPLLFHAHFEYAGIRQGARRRAFAERLALLAMYAPALYFALKVYPLLAAGLGFDFLVPGNTLGLGYGLWLAISCAVSSAWELRFLLQTQSAPERRFHALVGLLLTAATLLVVALHVLPYALSPALATIAAGALAYLPILPFAVLIYLVHRFNFLQIGRQKNLIYAVAATFLALLYLALVRRVGNWFEPVFPPEASAAVLLFLLVIFIEPIQRALGRLLRETAHREMDRVQRLIAEIQQEARQGDVQALREFIETRLKQQFDLAQVRLTLAGSKSSGGAPSSSPVLPFDGGNFVLYAGETPIGALHAEPHGASISGEARAALDFLCEQMPAALDLCRLIEEKLRLERELAQRERLAVLGQVAANISHNLKNPLGSIKTILQVQMESAELPESMRSETKIVLDEVDRLSSKLNQLLQFSRPAARASSSEASSEPRTIVEQVIGILRHEAERRSVALDIRLPNDSPRLAASPESMSDIVSNLIVNALEAAPPGGHVTIAGAGRNGSYVFRVEDDGPGISASAGDKILQPFFTTKTQGTGLGLAIVKRRVGECGGALDWQSPVRDGRGTRFEVTLPLAKDAARE